MSGVLNLYFTFLMQCNYEKNNINNFDGLKIAWKWLTDLLNMTPRPNITAEALCIFLKCCGYQMHKAYNKQFIKLIKICSSDYLKLIELIPPELQSGACVGRLKSVFESFRTNNYFIEWKKE
jgi:nucleoporin GLE1